MIRSIRGNFVWAVLVLVLVLWAPGLLAEEAIPTPTAALQKLKEGNARFVADKPQAKHVGAKTRTELAKGQHPFAIVLTCADSRVSPELIFDQGLGDLFVLRVAGNIADPNMIGSIEYALGNLKSPLIVVMGHEKCGAIEAALSDEKPEGNLGKLIKEVHVGKDLPRDKEEALPAAVKANTLYQARQLVKNSTMLKDFAASKRIRIVSAIYSLKTGEVAWLDTDEKK
jgi:carbonic anhydrase